MRFQEAFIIGCILTLSALATEPAPHGDRPDLPEGVRGLFVCQKNGFDNSCPFRLPRNPRATDEEWRALFPANVDTLNKTRSALAKAENFIDLYLSFGEWLALVKDCDGKVFEACRKGVALELSRRFRHASQKSEYLSALLAAPPVWPKKEVREDRDWMNLPADDRQMIFEHLSWPLIEVVVRQLEKPKTKKEKEILDSAREIALLRLGEIMVERAKALPDHGENAFHHMTSLEVRAISKALLDAEKKEKNEDSAAGLKKYRYHLKKTVIANHAGLPPERAVPPDAPLWQRRENLEHLKNGRRAFREHFRIEGEPSDEAQLKEYHRVINALEASVKAEEESRFDRAVRAAALPSLVGPPVPSDRSEEAEAREAAQEWLFLDHEGWGLAVLDGYTHEHWSKIEKGLTQLEKELTKPELPERLKAHLAQVKTAKRRLLLRHIDPDLFEATERWPLSEVERIFLENLKARPDLLKERWREWERRQNSREMDRRLRGKLDGPTRERLAKQEKELLAEIADRISKASIIKPPETPSLDAMFAFSKKMSSTARLQLLPQDIVDNFELRMRKQPDGTIAYTLEMRDDSKFLTLQARQWLVAENQLYTNPEGTFPRFETPPPASELDRVAWLQRFWDTDPSTSEGRRRLGFTHSRGGGLGDATEELALLFLTGGASKGLQLVAKEIAKSGLRAGAVYAVKNAAREVATTTVKGGAFVSAVHVGQVAAANLDGRPTDLTLDGIKQAFGSGMLIGPAAKYTGYGLPVLGHALGSAAQAANRGDWWSAGAEASLLGLPHFLKTKGKAAPRVAETPDFRAHLAELGLTEREATPEAVKNAHRRLAKEFHHDKNSGDEAALVRWKRINDARDAVLKRLHADALTSPRKPELLRLEYHGSTGEGAGAGAGTFPEYARVRTEEGKLLQLSPVDLELNETNLAHVQSGSTVNGAFQPEAFRNGKGVERYRLNPFGTEAGTPRAASPKAEAYDAKIGGFRSIQVNPESPRVKALLSRMEKAKSVDEIIKLVNGEEGFRNDTSYTKPEFERAMTTKEGEPPYITMERLLELGEGDCRARNTMLAEGIYKSGLAEKVRIVNRWVETTVDGKPHPEMHTMVYYLPKGAADVPGQWRVADAYFRQFNGKAEHFTRPVPGPIGRWNAPPSEISLGTARVIVDRTVDRPVYMFGTPSETPPQFARVPARVPAPHLAHPLVLGGNDAMGLAPRRSSSPPSKALEAMSPQECKAAADRLKADVDGTLIAYREGKISIEEALTFLRSAERLRGTGFAMKSSVRHEMKELVNEASLERHANLQAAHAWCKVDGTIELPEFWMRVDRRTGKTLEMPTRQPSESVESYQRRLGQALANTISEFDPRNRPINEEFLRLTAEEYYHAVQELRKRGGESRWGVSEWAEGKIPTGWEEGDVYARLRETLGPELVPRYYRKRYSQRDVIERLTSDVTRPPR